MALMFFVLADMRGESLKQAERNLHEAGFAEGRGATSQTVGAALADARMIAAALAEAAAQDPAGGDPMASVRAAVATCRVVDAARFEVPDAKVSTVLRQAEADPDKV